MSQRSEKISQKKVIPIEWAKNRVISCVDHHYNQIIISFEDTDQRLKLTVGPQCCNECWFETSNLNFDYLIGSLFLSFYNTFIPGPDHLVDGLQEVTDTSEAIIKISNIDNEELDFKFYIVNSHNGYYGYILDVNIV